MYEPDPLVRYEHKKVVAKAIAAAIYERACDELLKWEDYPELGEYDWEDVVAMVDSGGPAHPNQYEFENAYNALRVE